MAPAWKLRSATAEDQDRLFTIHRTAMRSYVEATWGEWRDDWQQERFAANFESAGWRVIEVQGQVAGMVSWEETATELWLSDIEIDPAFQRQGIGTAVISWLATTARAAGKPVTLRVLHVNAPARALYERLGFRQFNEIETHRYLRLDAN